MAALTERITASGRGLWLDYGAYAGQLLANGAVPWLDADAANGWLRKAQSLLKSDVVTLPVAAVAADWLRAHPELAEAMAAKRRAVFPLKTLLADEALRAHLAGLSKVLRASFGGSLLVLALPSPRLWVALAYAQAHQGQAVEVDADAVDSAAAYVADFLRSFGDSGLNGLLLEESAETEPASAQELQLYQAVLNVAAHYRWDLGLRLPRGGHSFAVPGLGFVLAPQAASGMVLGLSLPQGFWDGGTPPPCPAGGFRFAEIPAGTKPERVLERLAVLR
ncbi:MAG: hypothetical protein JOY51_08000 [Nevskia sp.]|nr:hypothetical protein [Nevskia sp.]